MVQNRRKLDRAQAAADLREAGGRLGRAILAVAALGAVGTALAFGGQLGWRWLTTSPTFAIHTIELRGNRHAASDELVRLSGLVPGGNLFAADVDAAEAALQGEPWIKAVEVRRKLPDSISIRVTEREPALLVALDKLYVADVDGTLFKRAQAGDSLDLPVVTGLPRQQFQEQRAAGEAKLREVLDVLAGYRGRALDGRYRIQEINLDADEGLSLQLAPIGSPTELQTVKLGEAPFDDKLEKLATLWLEFQRRGVKAQVVHLENRTRPNWVAVKLALADPAPASTSTKPPARPHN
ncbi:MAG: FtsQ-type POTRA domain-containing protein [Deltaproteobacteria bacterium]|nr:FtsQ-type POTRA domain-containing protein [Deltaproteobacteria bacterium]